MSEEELKAQLTALTKRIAQLEKQVASLSKEIPEDHIVAIAAAVAGYLGHRAKIRAVRFSSTRGWVTGTRRAQQEHQPMHLR